MMMRLRRHWRWSKTMSSRCTKSRLEAGWGVGGDILGSDVISPSFIAQWPQCAEYSIHLKLVLYF